MANNKNDQQMNASERDFVFKSKGFSNDELKKEVIDPSSKEAKEELFMQSIFQKQAGDLGVTGEEEHSFDSAVKAENPLVQDESAKEVVSSEEIRVENTEQVTGFWQTATAKIKKIFSKENDDINGIRSNRLENEEQQVDQNNANNNLADGQQAATDESITQATVQEIEGQGAVRAEKNNEAPTDITASENNVDENAVAGTVVATLSVTDSGASDSHVYSMADNANFELDGNQIKVKPGADLDFETAQYQHVDITVTDSEGNTYTETIEFAVNDLNEDPTDIDLSRSSVNENATTGTVVVNLSSTDEDAGETFTYSITANDNFEIDGSEVKVKAGADLDFESAESHNVDITVADSAGNTYIETVSLSVNNLNEDPTDISLSSSSVDENASTGTVVANLSSTDEDAGETFTYSIAANDDFEIDGRQIKVKAGADLDFETEESHSVDITVTDSAGNTYTESISLAVNNLNEAANFMVDSNSIKELGNNDTTTNNVITGNILSNDSDVDRGSSFSVLDANDGISVNTINTDGALVLDSTGGNPELLGGATSLDISIELSSTDTGSSSALLSYATNSQNNEVLVFADPNGNVRLLIAGQNVSSSIRTADLFDGEKHTFNFQWDSATGEASFYVDGESKGSVIIAQGHTIGENGTLMFGQEQDSNAGGLDDNQIFSGEYHGIEIATDGEIKAQWDMDSITDGKVVDSQGDFDLGVIGDVSAETIIQGQFGNLTLSKDGSYSYELNDENSEVQALGNGDSLQESFSLDVKENLSGETGSETLSISINGTNDGPIAVNDQVNQQISINENGSNGALVLDSKGDNPELLGGATSLDISIELSSTDTSSQSSLLSYATNSQNNEVVIFATPNGSVLLFIGGQNVSSNIGTAELFDGETHSFNFQWDSATGQVDFYLDGESKGSSTIAQGHTIGENGTLMFGQEQDSNGGGLDANQVFSGEYHNIEISTNGEAKAHWNMDTSEDGKVIDSVGEYNLSTAGDVQVITDQSTVITTDEETVITIDVLANDTDVEGDTLRITTVETPVVIDGVTVGTAEIVTVDGKQQIQFTPDESLDAMAEGDSKNISFSYSISDGNGGSDSATVSLTVTGSNDAPEITVVDTTATEDVAQVIATIADIDGTIDSSALSAEHGTVTLDDEGNITYTPDADYNGADTVNLSITDNGGATTTQTINLTIDATQDNPVAVNDGTDSSFPEPVFSKNYNNGAKSFDSQSNADEAGFTQEFGTEVTMSAWIKLDGNVDDYARVVEFGESDGVYHQDSTAITFGAGGDKNTLRGWTNAEGAEGGRTPEVSFDMSAYVDDGEYHLVTYTFDNAHAKLYVDEQEVDSVVISSPIRSIDNPDTINIGGYDGGSLYSFEGDIGGVGVFDQALDSDDVQAVYDAGPGSVIAKLGTEEDTSLTIKSADLLANDTDVDGDTLSITAVEAIDETHGTVEIDDDGNIVFTPEENYHGEASFEYTISDGNGGTDTASVTMTVENVNDAPVITVVDTTATEDVAQVIASVADLDGTIDSSALSAEHGTVTLDDEGNITYTPDADYNGADTVSLSITDDGGATTTQTINLTIDGTQDNPVAVNNGVADSENSQYVTDDNSDMLLLNEVVSSTELTVSLEFEYHESEGGSWATVLGNNSGGYHHILVNDNSNEVGFYNGRFHSSGVSLVEGESYNLTVVKSGTNSKLYINGDLVQDSNSSFDNAAGGKELESIGNYNINGRQGGNDSTYDNIQIYERALSTSEVTDIQGGSTVKGLAHHYTFEGDTDAERLADKAGDNNLTNDGGVFETNTVSKAITTEEDTSLTIKTADLLANDTDADGDILTVTGVSATDETHGTVSLDDDGNVVFTPEAEYSGEASFEYTISDGNGGTDTATVALNVENINDAPVITVVDTTAIEDVAQVIATVADIDGTINSSALSAEHGTVTLDDEGNITYTPDADYNGADTVSLFMTDNGGTTTTQTINLTIDPTQDNPVAVDDGSTVNNAMSFDGNNDYIGTNVNVPESDYSVAITFSTSEEGVGIYSVRSGVHSGAHDRNIYLDNDGNLCARVWNNETIKTQGIDFSDGEEHTVVHVLDGENQILYVDGEQLAIGDKGTSDFNWDGRIEIGYCTDAPHDFFEGNIADVQLYDKALSSAEAGDLSGGEAISTDNLLIHYDFEGDSLAEQLSDKSGNEYDGTAYGNPEIVESEVSITTNEDTNLTINSADLLANDTDVDGNTLTISAVNATDETHGTVEIDADGNVVFTPEVEYSGKASFEYTISDGNGGTDTATIALNVESINDAPVITVVDTTATEDVTQVIATVADIDGAIDSSTFSAEHGTVTLDDEGNITYTPDADYNGADTVSLSITDDGGATTTQTINLIIDRGNDNPVAVDDGAEITGATDLTNIDLGDMVNGAGSGVTVIGIYAKGSEHNLLDGIDDSLVTTKAHSLGNYWPDGENETGYNFMGGHHWFSEHGIDQTGDSLDGGIVSFSDGTVGVIDFISNGSGSSESAYIYYKPYENLNDSVTEIVATEDTSITIQAKSLLANDSDDDGDSLSVLAVITTDDTHGAVEIDDEGNVVFTPEENYHGEASFEYTVSDGHGGTDVATVTLNVDAANDVAVVGKVDLGAIKEDTSIKFSAKELLVNSSDADGDTLHVVDVSVDEKYGSVEFSTDREGNVETVKFIPAENYHGDDVPLNFVVSDGYEKVEGTAIIDVTAVDDEPVINEIRGTYRSETVTGSAKADHIWGEGGNDTINADAGNDIIEGGSGNDILNGGAGDDTFIQNQGDGYDKFYGGEGNDTISRGSGDGDIGIYRDFSAKNSIESIDAGGNNIVGDGYSSTLDFSSTTLNNVNEIHGGSGNDKITGTSGDDTIAGDSGNDTLKGGAGDDTFIQNRGDGYDAFYGGEGDDTVVQGDGEGDIGIYRDFGVNNSIETIDAGGNNIVGDGYSSTLDFSSTTLNNVDEIHGGGGNDKITGSSGDDTIYGDRGSDTLNGGAGNDTFIQNQGDGYDRFYGGEGNDTVSRGSGDGDIGIYRDFGADNSIETIDAGGNNIVGDDYSSTLDFSGTTLSNVNEIHGAGGNDVITGAASDDSIFGDSGADTLKGGAGDDVLNGGRGNDTAFGEEGNDTYVFNPFDGDDTFHGGDGGGWTDTIQLSANPEDGENPWTITIDGNQVDYDIDAGVLELQPDTSGVVTMADGSELNFDGVETIQW